MGCTIDRETFTGAKVEPILQGDKLRIAYLGISARIFTAIFLFFPLLA